VSLDIRGVGPLVVGERAEKLDAVRSSADSEGKSDGTLDIVHAGALNGITHLVKGGKLGALLETRDQLISSVLGRLDELAFGFSEAVNEVHSQGYSATGRTCIPFFEPMELTGASRLIALSEELLANPEEIVTAACPDSPGDNRVALAISRLQNQKLFGDSSSTVDEWYNSIVSEVGSTASHNKFAMNREKDIVTQLGRVRDQISGVSVDEETTQLLEFQHTFDASAKLIQIADEMLKTILGLKRD
jgi:flagellar hook-associated protein 1 FlgK